jgi:2-amino-1-hydroxyethylphosphonate dioxygenase (glycine-forming)
MTSAQGGRFTPAEVEEATKDPLLEQKLAVRRWDDQAKVQGIRVPGLKSYEHMAVQCLESALEP